MKKRLLSLCMAAAVLCAFTGCTQSAQDSQTAQETQITEPSVNYDLTVDFLKVGKADAAVIKTENHTVVIDCGEKSDGSKVRNCLNALGVDTVDYMILTHYDQDHIGGAAKVLKNFTVNHIIAANYSEESEEYTKLCEQMELQGLEFELPSDTMTFTLDDAVFQIYPCQSKSYHDGNDNNHSLVTRMTHHDEVFLFTGDAMQERLTEMMDMGDCDVLKEPYHGREVANLGEFLDHVTPEYAIVTTDEENLSEVTMQELADRSIETYVTFRDGNIRCTSTGKTVSFETGLNFKEEETSEEDAESPADDTNQEE